MTEMEQNHEFVLEKLFRGSIINYRTFFMEEDGKVYYKFGRNSISFELPISVMMEILPRHKELKKFQSFKQKTIIQNKPFPLDYIMKLPRHLQKRKDIDTKTYARSLLLENVLKNLVIRRLTDIRKEKAKPSLKDLIGAYLKKKGEKDERSRIRIKEQVLQIYEQKTFEQFEENDPNFNKIIVHIERILKITTAQTLAIDSLERKITNLSKRNPVHQQDVIIPKQDDKIKALLALTSVNETREELQEEDDKEIKFKDVFANIQEDKFESSDEEVEKQKNQRLERLGQVAEAHVLDKAIKDGQTSKD